MKWILIFTTLALSSCANTASSVQAAFDSNPQKIIIQNGKVKIITKSTQLEDGYYQLNCAQDLHPFYVKDKKAIILFAENYFSSRKSFNCSYKDIPVLRVSVSQFPYKKEKLNVSKKKVDYDKDAIKRIIAEKPIKKAIYTSPIQEALFDKPFIRPLNSYVTSVFGNKRLFNNKKQSQHFGNDLRAAVGVKIPASNAGKVVFSGDLFFSGNVVVIDHGAHIFTMYGHMSKRLVNKGDMVKQGQILGLAGATGRVSGPHLHWGVKVNGNWVDGFTLVEESKRIFAPKI